MFLAALLQHRHQRIGFAKQHPMVERRVHPSFQESPDVGEVHHHAARVELVGFNFHFDAAIVAVEMPARSVITQQPVPVTKVNMFGDGIHNALQCTHSPARRKGNGLRASGVTGIVAGMKVKLFGLFFLAVLLIAPLARAGTDDPPANHNALRKLGRGFANLLFGIVEIPNQYTKAVAEHGGAAGLTYGVPKGFVRWMGREFVGVYEIVTFPVPAPPGYKPVLKPEFPNEDFDP